MLRPLAHNQSGTIDIHHASMRRINAHAPGLMTAYNFKQFKTRLRSPPQSLPSDQPMIVLRSVSAKHPPIEEYDSIKKIISQKAFK